MLLLTTLRSIAEEERRARANDREYNEKFQYAVSVPCFRTGGKNIGKSKAEAGGRLGRVIGGGRKPFLPSFHLFLG